MSAAAVQSAYVDELLNAIPKGWKGVVRVGAGNLVISQCFTAWGCQCRSACLGIRLR